MKYLSVTMLATVVAWICAGISILAACVSAYTAYVSIFG